jgi:tetratricopeptide (TPR) repeat protein
LYLLGLFDHPIDTHVLELLWQSEHSVITDKFDMRDWKRAHRELRDKHHLLSTHVDNPNLLDCHPLIRAFFAKKLQQSQPQIWQYANEVLYKYYAELPRKRLHRDPENLLEMQPLFSAIEHGCNAGLHVEVFQNLYWPRVRKGTDNYLCKVLGAHADDLSCLSHFFTSPWQTVSANMPVSGQISLLSMTAFRLRALGRLQESVEPSLRSIALSKQAQDWVGFVNSTNNLSETQLLLGQVHLSIQTAKESVQVCDELSKDGTYDLDFERMSNRTTLADAFHQGGEYLAAAFQFEEAEKIKQNYEPEYPLLTSIEGYRYCNFLLSDSNDSEATTKVLFRSNEWLKWRVDSDSQLDVGFENLSAGKLKQKLGAFNDSLIYLNSAFNNLSSAGVRHHLPRVLLARAATYRLMGNIKLAYEDLEAVNEIAGRSDLRLHLVDYHLESARLALLVKDSTKLLHHQNEASKLIEETGYMRRKVEIDELENLCP